MLIFGPKQLFEVQNLKLREFSFHIQFQWIVLAVLIVLTFVKKGFQSTVRLIAIFLIVKHANILNDIMY